MCNKSEIFFATIVDPTNTSVWIKGIASEKLFFYEPTSMEEALKVRKWIYSIPDGSLIAMRGRDRIGSRYVMDEIENAALNEALVDSSTLCHPGKYTLRMLGLKRTWDCCGDSVRTSPGCSRVGVTPEDNTATTSDIDPRANDIDIGLSPIEYSPWECGVCLKHDSHLYLLWEAKVERYRIGELNFFHQFHLLLHSSNTPQATPHKQRPAKAMGGDSSDAAIANSRSDSSGYGSSSSTSNTTTNNSIGNNNDKTDNNSNYEKENDHGLHNDAKIGNSCMPSMFYQGKKGVVILCHGYSPKLGANYDLISILNLWLTALGFCVVTPDFRPSYRYGPSRGRSERVKIVLEDIISVMSACRLPIILIGHSQGGAAVSQACTSAKVVKSANIRGLVMIGSESPIERLEPTVISLEFEDDMNEKGTNIGEAPSIINLDRPEFLTADQILLVHSNRDRVISALQIAQLGEFWNVPVHLLSTDSMAEGDDDIHCDWKDDVQHDFIAHELLPPLYTLLINFLSSTMPGAE